MTISMPLILVLTVAIAILGAAVTSLRRPGPRIVAAVQHFAAGLVFAAAAAEVLPSVLHGGSIVSVAVGGAAGVATMLGLRKLGERLEGPVGMVTLIGVDILIDGLVLGLAFASGEREGLVLAIALSVEVLFLGLAVTAAFGEVTSRLKAIGATAGVALLLPLGALLGAPAHALPPHLLSALFAFGLIALLYLVTEELLVEAHECKDSAVSTALFFAGFLLLVVLEEGLR